MKKEALDIKADVNKLRTANPKLSKELGAIADSLDAIIDEASKGGVGRAKKLTPARRKEIASKASKKRWIAK